MQLSRPRVYLCGLDRDLPTYDEGPLQVITGVTGAAIPPGLLLDNLRIAEEDADHTTRAGGAFVIYAEISSFGNGGAV